MNTISPIDCHGNFGPENFGIFGPIVEFESPVNKIRNAICTQIVLSYYICQMVKTAIVSKERKQVI